MKANIITFDQIWRDPNWVSQQGGIYRPDQIINRISRTGIPFSGIQFVNFNKLSMDSALVTLCQLIDNEYQEFWDNFIMLEITFFEWPGFEWPGEIPQLMVFQKWLCKGDLEKADMDKWESEGMFLNWGGGNYPTYVFLNTPSKNHLSAYTIIPIVAYTLIQG